MEGGSFGGHLMLCSPAYSSTTGPPLPTNPRPMGWLSGRCRPLRGPSTSRKHSETAKEDSVWDMAVPYIMLGYNSSAQASTGLSPYEVMYGVPPTVPPAIRERYEGAIELDDPATAVVVVLRRAQALRECCIITGDNMLIAEHHDTVQYAEVRSGSYDPTTMHRIAPIRTAPHKNHSAKYCAAPHHTTPYHTAPHRTAQCRIKLHRIVPHRNASHRKRICTVMQRNAT